MKRLWWWRGLGVSELCCDVAIGTLVGKLFVQFVALIYFSYIKKQTQEKGLFKNYTLSGLLDKFDVIKCFEQPGKALRVGEMLDAQAELYYDLEMGPPTSL